jgi:hypothetical protein
LGYLDFRFPSERWREGRPALAEWFNGFEMLDSMMQTRPYQLSN